MYNLLPDFLDACKTEADIGRFYELTAEQVAAARAYILNNAETVVAEHLEIEARLAAENPPEVVERLRVNTLHAVEIQGMASQPRKWRRQA